MSTRPTRGRRPGRLDTRAEILAAARASFAEKGYSGTTIRGVAAGAGVDPALVHHYFGSKDDLFVAALELRVDPRVAMAPIIAAGPDGAGERLVRTLLMVWDEEENRLPLVALARGFFEGNQKFFEDGFLRMVLGPVGVGLGIDQPERRMILVASQMVGVVMLRYLVRVEPLASMDPELLVATYAPTLQRYLTGELP